VCPQKKKGLVEKKVSKTSFKCAQRREKKRVIKKSFKEVLQVCPQRKKFAKNKFQRSSSSVPLRKKKRVVKKSFKEVLQVCPQERKGRQNKSQRSCSSVSKAKVETTVMLISAFRELQQPPV